VEELSLVQIELNFAKQGIEGFLFMRTQRVLNKGSIGCYELGVDITEV